MCFLTRSVSGSYHGSRSMMWLPYVLDESKGQLHPRSLAGGFAAVSAYKFLLLIDTSQIIKRNCKNYVRSNHRRYRG